MVQPVRCRRRGLRFLTWWLVVLKLRSYVEVAWFRGVVVFRSFPKSGVLQCECQIRSRIIVRTPTETGPSICRNSHFSSSAIVKFIVIVQAHFPRYLFFWCLASECLEHEGFSKSSAGFLGLDVNLGL